MATVSAKAFRGYCAAGTATKTCAFYRVLDSDGFTWETVKIAASIHDAGVDEDINTAIEAFINA